MQRSDHNRWIPVCLLVLAGWIAPVFLYGLSDVFYPNDALSAVVFYGGTLLATAAVAFGVRRMTRMRRWWLISLFASPATLVLVFTVLVNLVLRFGPVGPSQGAGIGEYQPPWNPSSTYMPDVLYGADWASGGEIGSSFRLQDRTVWVYIRNHAGDVLAEDKFELTSGHPDGTAYWPRPEYVEITMSEVGYDKSNDPYGVALARSGPRPMFRLTYQYDSGTKKFRRTDLKILNPKVIRSAP